MTMKERVRIARRFLRSIRIDTDLGDASSLEGFICPQSSADVLITMARHVSETGQGAFTWTGPFGSGKSSLAIALSALLSDDADLQKQAARVFGHKLTTAIRSALPTGTMGWHIVPVVGRRDSPVRVIGEAMEATGLVARQPRGGWTESYLIQTAAEAAAANTRTCGGLIIFIDEMGKFLESAARDGTDIYAFQQLAELASRSNGYLLIVGILHQAFVEYAHRLSREMRNEWGKIQGRFIDLAVNTAGEEQIALISHAIESDHRAGVPSSLSCTVAALVRRERSADSRRLALMLENCWPLHPVVACLLGPVSRRRFGQNQRTIFGFLNSAEPHGFQDFLRRAEDHALYRPDQLWDYLRANLEPSILASPDGHRWALAVEALERCESIGGDERHIKLLKTVAVVDLFKERSGLRPSFALLSSCFPETSDSALRKTLDQLDSWSFTLFKKFLDAYAIYAGSDFDIDEAVRSELVEVDAVDFLVLKTIGGLQPILAKRHYHETGALRWFEVNLASLQDIEELAAHYQPVNGAIGQFLLGLPTEGENEEQASQLCRQAVRHSENWDIVGGVSKRSWSIMTLVRELVALECVRNSRAELAGDPVARREIAARAAALQGQLETELHKAFDDAQWFRKHHSPKDYQYAALNSLASDLADRRFDKCPKLHNELLNRQKPSSNAVAARNALLRRMVLNEGARRLGIEGYPAEGGLLASILEATGLYAQDGQAWRFGPPPVDDPCRLKPMWEAAARFARTRANKRTIAVSKIYDLWRSRPFGVKDGLMPVLAVAFILSHRNDIAIYRDGIFRSRIDDVDVEYLAKDPSTIQLRWMYLSDAAHRLLSGMAEIVHALDKTNTLVHLEPIDVARGLVAIYEKLPPWTKRTMRLSANAVRVRDLFKRARDPNQFLFDDIPTVIGQRGAHAAEHELQRAVTRVREGVEELVHAYPSMLYRLRELMIAELQVLDLSPQSLAELRGRAANIRQLTGDFHLEAFVGRISQFDGTDEGFEGIASLAVSKPPRDWVDPDLDRAAIEIAAIAQKFLRAETYARVKGRSQKRHAIAVVLGMNGRQMPLIEEFDIAEADRASINNLITRVAAILNETKTVRRSVILGALAELTALYIQGTADATARGKDWKVI